MSNPNALIIEAKGLNTQPNELQLPQGSLAVAENVEITRDNVIQMSPGFENFSTELPDFKPDQIFSSGGILYANLDGGLWWYNTATPAWERIVYGATGIQRIAGIWVDAAETYAYICDKTQHVIYRVTVSDGVTSLFAGLPGSSGTTNGVGTAAKFNSPIGIWGDGTNLYVCDKSNFSIRKIVISTATVSTFAGLNGTAAYTDNAVGTTARFQTPHGIWSDGTNLFVSEPTQGRIRKITIGGTQTVTTLTSSLTTPKGVWMANASGTLYVATSAATVLKSVNTTTGVDATVSGSALTGDAGGDSLIHSDGTYVWVTQHDNGSVSRVTISGGTVSNTIFPGLVATETCGVWVFANKLWVTGYSSSFSVAYPGTGKRYGADLALYKPAFIRGPT